jgi:hypothetical protein
MIKILIDTDKTFMPKARYVFTEFCRILGIKAKYYANGEVDNVDVYYGTNLEITCKLRINHAPIAVEYYKKKELYDTSNIEFLSPSYSSLKKSDTEKPDFSDIRIPFLFSQKGEICTLKETYISINKDIISSAFYFMSCWQEYVNAIDDHLPERYDYYKSMQYKCGFTTTPVVDHYIAIFRECLNDIHILKEAITATYQHKFTLLLSHDIDYYNYWSGAHFKTVLKYNFRTLMNRPFSAIYKIILHTITKQLFYNPLKRLQKMYKKEENLNCKSTSFLLTLSDDNDERQEYFSSEKHLRELKKILLNRPHGLHGSKQATFDYKILLKQKSLFESNGFVTKGYRNHYLYFDYQRSFSALEKAGFLYDATLGFSEHIGYRAGISHPFYPFNILEDRPFNILEIPLSIMDVTLFSKTAMNLSYGKAKSLVFEMIDKASLINSHITILWHNTSFEFIDFPFWGKLYWDTIRYSKKKGARVCSVCEGAIDDKSKYQFFS